MQTSWKIEWPHSLQRARCGIKTADQRGWSWGPRGSEFANSRHPGSFPNELNGWREISISLKTLNKQYRLMASS